MNNLEIFKNEEFGEIRTIVINDTAWFVGRDVCKIFGDKNHSRSIGRIDDEDKREEEIIDSLGRKQKAIFINESGLYSLLFTMQPQKSNKNGVSDAYPIEIKTRIEKLKKFKRWVTSEVLPQIRQTGGYIPINKDESNEEFLARAFLIATETLKKKDEIIARKDRQLEEQKPLVDFANKVSDSSNLIDMGKMAKLLKDEHIKIGRNRLFDWLRRKEILMKNNIPYQRYIDGDYFRVKESTYETPYGTKTQQTTYVTGKGQIYITEKLRKEYCA